LHGRRVYCIDVASGATYDARVTDPAGFKDHFSRQSADYARYRPGYPAELFDFLAASAPGRELALDCATGSGQAALGLAAHFARVLAIDASAAQLAHALPHPRIEYRVATAEQMPLADGAADLVVAAQAAHWFDFARFHAECRRVLRPGGLVALWTYEKFRVDPAVDAAVDGFYAEVIGPYWPPERRHVEEGYRTLPFPYEELAAPTFELRLHWDVATTLRYVGTWSAVQRYRDARGLDPLPQLGASLEAAWPGGEERELHWPIHLRLGRV
jgi:SAM-dependent methyltransferase